MNDKLKPILFGVLVLAATALIYRIACDPTVSIAAVSGLIIVAALAIITLLSERLLEFSASSKGVSAKLGQLDQKVSEIKTFLLGGIDEGSVATLKAISTRQLVSPLPASEKDELKFRLRTLRRSGFVLRDETKCESIADAVRKEGNISDCFRLTRLAVELLENEPPAKA